MPLPEHVRRDVTVRADVPSKYEGYAVGSRHSFRGDHTPREGSVPNVGGAGVVGPVEHFFGFVR